MMHHIRPANVLREPVERGSQSRVLVEHIQHQLITHGFSLAPYGADGKFGQTTEEAVKKFQTSRGLPATGIVDNATFNALAVSLPEATVDLTGDAGAPEGSEAVEDPPRPPFPPLVGNDQRAAVFGQLPYVPAPTPSWPEGIRILGDWVPKNLKKVFVPQLAQIPGIVHQGHRVGQGPASGQVLVHRLVERQLVSLWQAWEDAGLLDRVITWGGLWAARFIRGSRTVLSNHCFASAFDVNASWNALGANPAPRGTRGSVIELVELAHEHGFYWGGHFRRCDAMHFEVAKIL
jgi:hypothetical protein